MLFTPIYLEVLIVYCWYLVYQIAIDNRVDTKLARLWETIVSIVLSLFLSKERVRSVYVHME
jgi:hypothetical protein